MQVDTMWDDYIDRTGTKEIRISLYKADATKYIYLDLTDIMLEKIDQQGEGYEGYYATTLSGQASALSGEFVTEGTYATDYQGETT